MKRINYTFEWETREQQNKVTYYDINYYINIPCKKLEWKPPDILIFF